MCYNQGVILFLIIKNMFKKVIWVATLATSLLINAHWAYTEVDCSTSNLFSNYSCNQCFDWWSIKIWDNISFLDDLWVNDTTSEKIMYKEDQTMPVMSNLNWSSFTKNPNDDTFWEYTPEFEALKSADKDWYVLPIWKSVSWIKSTLWSSYRVDSLPAKWTDAWMLVFDIMSHNILANWEVQMNDKTYKECVLYKSDKEEMTTPPPEPENPPEPGEMIKVKTWPEMYFLIIIFAFLTGLIISNRKIILEKIRK